MSDAEVLFRTEPLEHGGLVGIATLNVEKTLNSLSLNMVDLLQTQLSKWEEDSEIAFVWFEGAGRAFCAGGDIQNLYHDMANHLGGPCPYCEDFFSREYKLDYLIHTYKKPTIVFAHGIVMGGGLGIASACDFRIGTEKTRIAMPEITIGLIPDAGATWSFMQMPKTLAHFLALTGAQINGLDAKHVGLVNHLLPSAGKDALFAALKAEVISKTAQAGIQSVVSRFENADEFPASQIVAHEDLIDQVMGNALSDENPVAKLTTLVSEFEADDWLKKAAGTFMAGAPATAQIIVEQFARAISMNLKQMLEQEMVLASQCSRHPDFAVGVRALLIDKDADPKWRQGPLGSVPSDWIEEHFVEPWDQNPLADLDETRLT